MQNSKAPVRAAVRVALAALALAGSGFPASAQNLAADYPSRPIRFVVGFGPGGGNDILARLIGQKLSDSFGQPVVVENKPGAGGTVAAQYLKSQEPDGHTIMMGASGAMAISPAINPRLGYSPTRDFEPVVMVGSFPLVMVVSATSPVRSVKELVAEANANPGQANYGSSSASFQLASELFKQKSGARLEHIPYRSSAEAVTGVLSGQVLMAISEPPPVIPQVKAGQLRALAVTSPMRAPELPDVPTMAEAGAEGVEAVLWSGVFVPKGTPPGAVEKLQAEVARIVRLPEIRERMAALSVQPEGGSSDDFRSRIEADVAKWTAVAGGSGLKLEP